MCCDMNPRYTYIWYPRRAGRLWIFLNKQPLSHVNPEQTLNSFCPLYNFAVGAAENEVPIQLAQGNPELSRAAPLATERVGQLIVNPLVTVNSHSSIKLFGLSCCLLLMRLPKLPIFHQNAAKNWPRREGTRVTMDLLLQRL